MKRRAFIAMLGGAAAAWPLRLFAQGAERPVVGFVNGQSAGEWAPYTAAFVHGLRERGYVEGRNVTIDYHWAEGRYGRLTEMVADLVRRRVSVIVISGGASAAVSAAKNETSTIPIVFTTGIDLVRAGLVASLNRPGGNVTGVTVFTSQLGSKRVQLLRELLPKANAFALLVNPHNPIFEFELNDVREAMHAIGLQLHMLEAGNDLEVDSAFAAMAGRRADALIVGADPFFNSRRARLTALAMHYRIPAIWEWREFADVGGLMSYGTILPEMYRQLGNYAGRILGGERAADLPVLQPTKFEFVINLKTAKALGLDIPATLLARADEVIE
jgi:putative tryptophan/tyrosine transport system substrate-binding protein